MQLAMMALLKKAQTSRKAAKSQRFFEFTLNNVNVFHNQNLLAT